MQRRARHILPRRALFQCGAIASHASNILPGSGAQFHCEETTRQAIDAETRLCLSVQTVFRNSTRSGPTAMGAAKRHGPNVQRGRRLSRIAVHDRFLRRLRDAILYRCRTQSLIKIAHFAAEGGCLNQTGYRGRGIDQAGRRPCGAR
jgi:hypothetical protein